MLSWPEIDLILTRAEIKAYPKTKREKQTSKIEFLFFEAKFIPLIFHLVF